MGHEIVCYQGQSKKDPNWKSRLQLTANLQCLTKELGRTFGLVYIRGCLQRMSQKGHPLITLTRGLFSFLVSGSFFFWQAVFHNLNTSSVNNDKTDLPLS